MPIHPTAVIDPSAELDPSVDVGPYAMIENDVRVGVNTRLYAHAFIGAYTTIGANCQIHPFAIVGHTPQDTKFRNEPSYAVVGDGTIVRELASIHRGTEPGSTTVVGRECFLMAAAHVGHNCELGNNVILANGVLLGGHVSVGDRAFISGNVALHQFTRIGRMVMIAGGIGRVVQDVPPFMMVGPNGVTGLNVVGLRRGEISSEERRELRRCHQILYRDNTSFAQGIQRVSETVQTDAGRQLAAFLAVPSKRGYLRFKRHRSAGAETDETTCES